jgi:hypothetical protein
MTEVTSASVRSVGGSVGALPRQTVCGGPDTGVKPFTG